MYKIIYSLFVFIIGCNKIYINNMNAEKYFLRKSKTDSSVSYALLKNQKNEEEVIINIINEDNYLEILEKIDITKFDKATYNENINLTKSFLKITYGIEIHEILNDILMDIDSKSTLNEISNIILKYIYPPYTM
ncbi:MAG: hypothetical protein GY830_08315, partial [Bacteroidetes bacterium]|nr:hypothetical protein [Bacteroidota bacterium]